MSANIARRDWLKQSTLAAFGLGISLQSMAGEDYLPKHFGSEKGLLNLGANENPYGMSPKARQAIIDMIPQANRYLMNVPSLQTFKKELTDYYKLTPDQIIITAGSGQALAFLPRHFSKGGLVTADNTFAILPSTAKRIGTKVTEVPLTHDKLHDLPAMMQAINGDTQIVYICNPANPTGTILKSSDLKNFCEEASKKAVVIVDEAYIDLVDPPDNESMIGLVNQYPNLLILRTFSKIHGLAGLRIGFVIGHPSLISKLDANYFLNTQFNVSDLSHAAAQASMQHEEHRQMNKQKNVAARQYNYDELTRMNFHVIPSYTNFLFFQMNNFKGDFAAEMLKKEVVLRSGDYPDGKWTRVSIGTIDEMQRFIKLMKNYPNN